jgi:hypothetical protein
VSIYASSLGFDAAEHADSCAKWKKTEAALGDGADMELFETGDRFWLDADTACTCAAGPILYRGSHILPSAEDARGGCLDLAEIPGHITRDGRDDGPTDDDTPWPYLRASMGGLIDGVPTYLDCVLDRALVAELSEYLVVWLDRTATEETDDHGSDG